MSDTVDIRLDLLLFSVCGVYFGVESGQVEAIAAFDDKQADDLFWFHEELEYGEAGFTYVSPTVITIKTEHVRSYRVIIDGMEDIAECSHTDISLFPDMLEPFTLRRGLWGILPRNGHMVLLVDFKRLLKEKRPEVYYGT
jgi:hypothetical protein